MTDVTIEYCVPCGFLEQSVEIQTALLERFGRDLDSVALEPGHGGVFKIRVDEETVWDKDEDGADLDLERIGDAVDDHLAPAGS